MSELDNFIDLALENGNGILPLEPTFVANDLLVATGRRLNLPDSSYDQGERGVITERWLSSVTSVGGQVGLSGESLSHLRVANGPVILLKDVLASRMPQVLGEEYVRSHNGLGRIAKILDYWERIPLHFHPRERHTCAMGRHQKDEAFYFLDGSALGPHPETFLGLHSSLKEESVRETLLPYLEHWDTDGILSQSAAQQQVPDDGFYVPSGLLHGPGTALTLELSEDSLVSVFVQAVNEGRPMPRHRMTQETPPDEWAARRERAILDMLDWEANCDPYLYERYHIPTLAIGSSRQSSGSEYWILYGSRLFSGKKMVVHPGGVYLSKDRGAYGALVVQGSGSFGPIAVSAGNPHQDEVFVTFSAATSPIRVTNTGSIDLIVTKFFGPDINPDAPTLNDRGL